jgi:ankyrin repeat protein
LFASCSENLSFELNKAAENGDNTKIKELLSKGANINGTDTCMTPLMRAILTGHVETVKFLLIHGANPGVKNDCSGVTAFNYADKIQSPEILRMLFRADAVIKAGNSLTEDDFNMLPKNESNSNASTTSNLLLPLDSELLDACNSGDKRKVIRLLKSGANIESKNEIGETPLVIAGRYYHPDIMSILIDKGANVNAKSELGTPLLYAAEFNYIEIVRKLIAKGADVNLADASGITPLQTAEGPKNKTIVQMLKKAGARE